VRCCSIFKLEISDERTELNLWHIHHACANAYVVRSSMRATHLLSDARISKTTSSMPTSGTQRSPPTPLGTSNRRRSAVEIIASQKVMRIRGRRSGQQPRQSACLCPAENASACCLSTRPTCSPPSRGPEGWARFGVLPALRRALSVCAGRLAHSNDLYTTEWAMPWPWWLVRTSAVRCSAQRAQRLKRVTLPSS